MLANSSIWLRRHKRISRRFGRDIRLLLPYLIVAFCFLSLATAILAAEHSTF
jgi:hypothetical protein